MPDDSWPPHPSYRDLRHDSDDEEWDRIRSDVEESEMSDDTPISTGSGSVTRRECELTRVPIDDAVTEFKGWAVKHDDRHVSERRWVIGTAIGVIALILSALKDFVI